MGKDNRSLVEMAVDFSLSVARPTKSELDQVRRWLEGKVLNGKFVLLLDGLDELDPSRKSWLRQELQNLASTSVVLTTRYHAEPRAVLPQHSTLRMLPIRWSLIGQFIVNYLSSAPDGAKLANELRRNLRLNPNLRRLAQNAFLLGVMCHLTEEG